MDDFKEEIQAHLALEADHRREEGEADAEASAKRAFGNIAMAEETFYEKGHWMFLDHLRRDLRHGLRLMRRRPGFTAVVVLTLALGIGANTAIFSLLDAVLLRPLPYRDPGRLAMLWAEDTLHNDQEEQVSLLNFADWKSQSHTFEDMALFRPQTFLLGSDGSPDRMRSARVSANFFPLLGIEPFIGRVFTPEEESRAEQVVILSYGLWQRQYGGSPQAVGSELTMDGRKLRIIGVMPATFQFPFEDTQVWEPLSAHPYWAARDKSAARSDGAWYVLGRIRQEASLAQAQAEMNAIARRLHAQYADRYGLPDISVVPLHTQTTGKSRNALLLLFGSVFLILLIACTNVANLLLARGSAREREFAVRRALGASRVRVARQLLTESLVLAAAGGLLALPLASLGLKALVAFGPRDIPRMAEAQIDLQALLFAFTLSLLSAILSGFWPALQTGTAQTGARQWITVASRSMRGFLIAGEFALALMLLTGAGLLIRSFLRLEAVDPGFRPDNLLSMRIDLHVGRTPTQEVAYFREAIERTRALPGVRSVAAIGRFLKSYGPEQVSIEGRVTAQNDEAAADLISGPYFETAGIPLKKGRFFTDDDRLSSPPVAIINEAMARSYWPSEDPIGKRFNFSERKPNPWITVVGVVGNMHRQGLEKEVAPQIFRPHSQDSTNEMDLLVRTNSDPLAAAQAIRSKIQSIDKTVAKFGVTTVASQMGEQTAERRFHTSLIGLFSLIALFLSTIGIYGLMHFFVVQRTHEIGVRMALGAQYGTVMALVLRQGLLLAATGGIAGLLGAIGLTRLLSGMLFGVGPADPVTFLLAPLVLLAAAALACWLPARRAARINPIVALRQD
ncbi:MAG TPA: ABC transporter permease [Candidatus Angelobacter sp.]|nr:ABC transporter permease [Candidatus Angelobacter sp.]